MKSSLFFMSVVAGCMFEAALPVRACTGITLKSRKGETVVARTIEWGGSNLESRYVVVPRGHSERSYTPDGQNGMLFTARYGYVGLAVEQKEFVVEGINEAGLSAGLFYFPGYGEYEEYDKGKRSNSISDFQLVSWLLGRCATVEEVKDAVAGVHVVNIDPRASTVHWRFVDTTGRQLVLEITGRKVHFYENKLGVLTNSPGFEWHLTNLNNYVNLRPGVTRPHRLAPQKPTVVETVLQCFQILNNFDIPIGIETLEENTPTDIPSATQWTSATDVGNRIVYFRTMYDSTIRSIDLRAIDFAVVDKNSFILWR